MTVYITIIVLVVVRFAKSGEDRGQSKSEPGAVATGHKFDRNYGPLAPIPSGENRLTLGRSLSLPVLIRLAIFLLEAATILFAVAELETVPPPRF